MPVSESKRLYDAFMNSFCALPGDFFVSPELGRLDNIQTVRTVVPIVLIIAGLTLRLYS